MDVSHEWGILAIAQELKSISVDQPELVEVLMDRERELDGHRVLRGYLFQSE